MSDITLPQLGETVTEGTVTKWYKQVGERIEEGETLFEVSSDKVDSEVPSPATGYLVEIIVPQGETAEVGARLAVISDQPPGEGEAPDAEAAEPEAKEAEAKGPAEEEKKEEGEAPAAEAPTAGDGEAAEPAPPPRAAAKARPSPAEAPPGGDRDATKLLSPVVRRLVAEHDVDPADIPATGQGGRITRSDVLAYIDEGGGRRPAAPDRAPAAEPAAAVPAAAQAPAPAPRAEAGAGDEVIPFSNIRRRTAEHMVRSKATSAHVLTVIEVDFHNVDRVRQAARESFKAKEGFSLTYLPFVCRAVVEAVEAFPHVNASVGEDELVVHRQLHLGIAVDLAFEGLIVPVVHDADTKRLRAIAREIADLASRARSRKLSADDISGGTFTITNPGPFGTLMTAPVINQPQVAILSTDGVKKRPVAVELPGGGDGIAVHPVGNLALSFDHRAFDGAYASAFLARCRQVLEQRDWSEEL